MLPAPEGVADFDCVVVGAGHAGLLMARLSADLGLRTALIDKRSDPRAPGPGGRRPAGWGLSINLGTVNALRRAGLWAYFADKAQPVTTMRVIDPIWKQDVLYKASEIGAEALSWGLTGADLEDALLCAVFDQPAITPFWNETVVGHAPDPDDRRCALTCASGRRLLCRLVIVADGRHSPLRSSAGLDGPRADFRQTALTLGVTTEFSHDGAGFEVLRLGGPLAFLPLPEHDPTAPNAALTWVLPNDEATRRRSADPAAVTAELSALMPERLGGIRITTPIAGFPLTANHAKRLVGRRLALIGDAAHGLHPIHAQGFNLAARDIGCLMQCLADARRRGTDVGQAALLHRYQAARLPDTIGMSLFSTGFGAVSGSSAPIARAAIGVGGLLLQRIPALRGTLARLGAGTVSISPPPLRRAL